VDAPHQDEARKLAVLSSAAAKWTIVVAPAWCLGQHGRRGASNHVSGQRYFGDVCSALASQFASWKSRASRARAQNKGGDQKRAARLQQHAHAPETLSIDSIESSSGVATIAEGERGQEGARGQEALA
jgi:hypothetical protein